MRIALLLESQEGLTWPQLLDVASRADECGFDGLYVSDHFGSVDIEAAREVMPAWTAIAVLAARTQRVRIGSLVSPVTWRHPVDLCKQAIALDLLTSGRIDVGFGAAWHGAEHERFGFAFPEPAKRVARLAEALEVFSRLWVGEEVTISGEYYSLLRGSVLPRPETPKPPVILGGEGKAMLRLAAKYAKEWNCFYKTPEEFGQLSRRLDDACDEAGRDRGSVGRSLMTPLLIGRTDREVDERILANRAVFAGLPGSRAEWRSSGFIGGTVEELREQLGSLSEAGATRVIFEHIAVDDPAILELVSEAGLLSG